MSGGIRVSLESFEIEKHFFLITNRDVAFPDQLHPSPETPYPPNPPWGGSHAFGWPGTRILIAQRSNASRLSAANARFPDFSRTALEAIAAWR